MLCKYLILKFFPGREKIRPSNSILIKALKSFRIGYRDSNKMISTTAMAEIKNPDRPIPFDNNALSPRHSGIFPRADAKCDTVLHHPEWKTSFEGEKPRLFHFPSYRIFSSGSRRDFRTFRDQVDVQESPSCLISIFLSREKSS